MNPQAQKVRDLFVATVKTPPDQWQAFLKEACAGDEELRRQVSDLLQAHQQAGSFLDQPATPVRATSDLDSAVNGAAAPEDPGATIGPYKLQERIGEGGMGAVWLAEQREPVQRKIALKIVKAGMDSQQVVARFEAERQALALMDHANIARVFDGGTTAGGRPYFVMELVKGVPITEYCDEHRLTPRERLELFVPVCQAIQHAHTKGIIHRDVKPSNVLVAPSDGGPVPKVIDFGVAKATGQRLTEKTLFTGFGAVVGTLEYMSPEQAQLNNQDVDTRSDIYSLGVLLYELLTGTTPLRHERLTQLLFTELLRLIREEEPPRPSTRLSESTEALPAISAQRHTEPAKLTKLVRGELDWIVMKALEKDRNRRYETANAFALDVQHYLADEPVLAWPPSVGYRLRKLVRRHRGPVLAAAAVLLALVGGIVGTSWGLVREAERAEGERLAKLKMKEERDAREEALQVAETQRGIAEANEKRADRDKRIAQAVRAFLHEDLLRMADARWQAGALPRGGRFAAAANPTVKELLDRAAEEVTPEKIERKFPGQPLVQAEVLWTIGYTYRATGEYAKAIAHLERSRDLVATHLGADHLTTLTILGDLAGAYKGAGRVPEAIGLFEQVRDKMIATLGPDHPHTLQTLDYLAGTYKDAGRVPEALRLYEQVSDRMIAKLGPDHPITLMTLNNLAVEYLQAGRLPEAMRLHEQVRNKRIVVFGPDHPDTLITLDNLAGVYKDAGRLPEAIRLYERVRDKRIATLGPDHRHTPITLRDLAGAYRDAGRLPEAIRLLEQVRDKMSATLGPDDVDTLKTLDNLAGCFADAGRLPEAIRLYERVRDKMSATLGPDHPTTLITLHNLATAYTSAERLPEAIRLLEQVRDKAITKVGPDHPITITTLHNLATAYVSAGKLPEAIRLLEQVRDKQMALGRGADHPHTQATLRNLAHAYQGCGKLPEAIRLFEQLRDAQERTLGPDFPHTLTTLNRLGVAYWSARRLDRSVPVFEEELRRRVKAAGKDHSETIRAAFNLGVNYRDAGRGDDAVRVFDEWLAHAAKALPVGHEVRGFGRSAGAETYAAAGHHDQAEPLLREAAKLAKLRAGADAPAYAGQLAALGHNLLRQQKWADAESVLRECSAIRDEKQADAWATFSTRSMLGSALLGQKKYAEAEPLLLQGYEGLKQREAKIPEPLRKVRLTEAVERLVQLYDAWGKPDEAAKWRKELETYKQADRKPDKADGK